jgi:hypothetical protein
MLGDEVIIRIYEVEGNQSDPSLHLINTADLELFYYNKGLINHETIPLQAGKGWHELPEWIRNSKSIVNIQSNDDSCFKWCVTRYFFEENGINYRVTSSCRNGIIRAPQHFYAPMSHI